MSIFLWTPPPQADIIRPYRIPVGQGDGVGQGNGVAQMGQKKIGDAFEILYGLVRSPSNRPKASPAAFQWDAERTGRSYGLFTQHLTAEDEARIEQEYNEWRDAN